MAGEDEYVQGLAEEVAAALMPLLAERLEDLLDSRPLLTTGDVAKRLRCSQSKVYGLIREGVLSTVPVGAQQRVEERELRRYIASLRDGGVDGAEGAGR